MIEVSKGLDDVIVGTTAVSDVRGDTGELIYRGHSIDELVNEPFADVAALVATGNRAAGKFINKLTTLTDAEVTFVLALPTDTHAMHLLQAITPIIEPNAEIETYFASQFADPKTVSHGMTIAAKIPLILALHLKRQQPEASVHTDYIGRHLDAIDAPNSDIARKTFEVIQILQLEHSFNASTFTARVVSSTLAPIENCLAAAFGALHGVLHGGADQAALETADQVGDPSKANEFVDRCLIEKTKVMGMGHREYRMLDPRAKHIKGFAEQLTRGTDQEVTFKTLEAIESRFRERMADAGKELHANIEFYKGVVYRNLGLPTHFFTAHFAMARVYGYIAHVYENLQDNKLIRPGARYVGN